MTEKVTAVGEGKKRQRDGSKSGVVRGYFISLSANSKRPVRKRQEVKVEFTSDRRFP